MTVVMAPYDPPPRNSAGAAPLRRAGSIRRTLTIDVDWPDGRVGDLRLSGRARDAVTTHTGAAPTVVAEDAFLARLRRDRTIAQIESLPPRLGIEQLVGKRAGGQLRRAVDEILPDERRLATPLHLLLDDIAGAALVSLWAWSRHTADWRTPPNASVPIPDMQNVCAGFRTGSSAFASDGSVGEQNYAQVDDLRNPADPQGWHRFEPQTGVALRRARRIDLWLQDGLIEVDTAFQDSAAEPNGGRVAVHEYRLTATVEPESFRLLSVHAEPRVLPYAECPAAAANAARMIGSPLPAFREMVLTALPGVAGCTHLNDALRALAEAPALAQRLSTTSADAARREADVAR